MTGEKLEIGGIKADELAEKFETPLYVYDAEKIREQYRKLENAFKSQYDNFQINYAVKANSNPAIAEILVDEGAGLDCASQAELQLAEYLDVGSEDKLYTAPFNRKEDLEFAVEQEATVNLDSVELLEKLSEMPERIAFRIDPGIGRGDFGLVLGGGSKFGISKEEAVKGYRKAKENGVERFGVHMMTGSNVTDPEYFGEITERLLRIAGEIAEEVEIEFEFIDIGGGLGIPYRPEDEELDVEAAAENTVTAFREGLEKHEVGEPELWVEPGRFLVAESGVLLTQVTGVKQKDKAYIGTDTGMHQMIRPMLYDAYHEIKLASDLNREVTGEKDVVGCVCENDFLARDRKLPDIETGELLAVMNAGAYGFVMASNWNSRPLPQEILVEDSESEVIREKQDRQEVFHGTEIEKKEG